MDEDCVHTLRYEVLHLLELLVRVTLPVSGDDVHVVFGCLSGELIQGVPHEDIIEILDGDAHLELLALGSCNQRHCQKSHQRKNKNLPHTHLLGKIFGVCHANACIMGL